MKRSEITIQKSDRQIPVAFLVFLVAMKLPFFKFPYLDIVSDTAGVGRELILVSDGDAGADSV